MIQPSLELLFTHLYLSPGCGDLDYHIIAPDGIDFTALKFGTIRFAEKDFAPDPEILWFGSASDFLSLSSSSVRPFCAIVRASVSEAA
ncbi:MAG: hypothetical protein MJ135_07860, partial [Oscillospiraceae bacterium]|nr:hypothetical protein [Oscillospiraceae bacterium]